MSTNREMELTLSKEGSETYLVVTNPGKDPEEYAAMRLQITQGGVLIAREAIMERLNTLLMNGKFEGITVPIQSVLGLLAQMQR